MGGVLHFAGEPVDGVQTCRCCGEVLMDNRNVAYIEADGPPGFFPEGPVTVWSREGGGGRAFMTGDNDNATRCGSEN